MTKNIIKLASSKLASVLILLISLPIITRIYQPEDIGIQSAYIATIMLFLPICCLRGEFAIVVADHISESKKIVKLNTFISVGMALLVGLFVLLLSQSFNNLISSEKKYWFIFLIVINFFLEAQIVIYSKYALSIEKYSLIATIDFIKQLILAFTPILSYFVFGLHSNALIISYFLSSAIAALFYFPLYRDVFRVNKVISIPYKVIIRKNIDFFTYGSLGSGFNGAATSIPILLMGEFFGKEVLGLLSMSMRLLSLPVKTISSSLNSAFFGHTKHLKPSDELSSYSIKSVKIACIAFSPFIIIYPSSDEVMTFILGEKWAGVGEYYKLLIILYFAWNISLPLSSIFSSLYKQKSLFYLQLTKFTTRVGSLVFGYWLFNDIYKTLLLYIIISTLAQFMQVTTAFKFAGGRNPHLFLIIFTYALPSVAFAIFIGLFFNDIVWIFFLSAIFMCLNTVYFSYITITKL